SYNSATGTITDKINKVTLTIGGGGNGTIVITGYTVVYDAAAHTATGVAKGVSGEDLSNLLNLSATTHTNVGTYSSDAWSFAGNANYNSASGTVSDKITKVSPAITVSASGPINLGGTI